MQRAMLSLAAAFAGLAGPAGAAMRLTSADLPPAGAIAAAQIYPRCGGQNISPALSWSGTPATARSLVLTMIDQDVKPDQWSHWIVVDLPPSTTSLPRGVTSLPGHARAVVSNFGDAAYDGPCPPPGTGVHHYQFTIWAMPAATTTIAPDAKADQVGPRLAQSALGRASLAGWVKR